MKKNARHEKRHSEKNRKIRGDMNRDWLEVLAEKIKSNANQSPTCARK